MANIQLYICVKVDTVADDNTVLAADVMAAPVNWLLYTMFSQVYISLNDTLISNSMNTYPYQAILETLLTYDEDAKK